MARVSYDKQRREKNLRREKKTDAERRSLPIAVVEMGVLKQRLINKQSWSSHRITKCASENRHQKVLKSFAHAWCSKNREKFSMITHHDFCGSLPSYCLLPRYLPVCVCVFVEMKTKRRICQVFPNQSIAARCSRGDLLRCYSAEEIDLNNNKRGRPWKRKKKKKSNTSHRHPHHYQSIVW